MNGAGTVSWQAPVQSSSTPLGTVCKCASVNEILDITWFFPGIVRRSGLLRL